MQAISIRQPLASLTAAGIKGKQGLFDLPELTANQQKFFFELVLGKKEGKMKVKASTSFSMLGYTKMDLDIVKLHFEIGAGRENFEWA